MKNLLEFIAQAQRFKKNEKIMKTERKRTSRDSGATERVRLSATREVEAKGKAMDVYSWIRRSLSRSKRTSLLAGEKSKDDREEDRLYGVTETLIEFIKSFSVETFRNFSLPDEDRAAFSEGTSGNVEPDLSDWQQHHALLVLSRAKELAQLRFKLCPRYLKERLFWSIYFILVKSYVAEYELQAVRLARLKQMSTENESISDIATCEVEMLETKLKIHSPHEISLEDSDCHDNIKN